MQYILRKYRLKMVWFAYLFLCTITTTTFAQAGKGNYYLIAHRGGVVDSTNAENSLPALQAAARRGYRMVEIDLRLTKDSVLIIHHDRDFKRYFNVNQQVSSMTWKEISRLRSDKKNSKVLRFEDALRFCSGKLQVMIDNKIDGYDTVLFSKIVTLLKKYGLDKQALMIGTDESTEYFTGKIALSCTRKQLEDNMKRPDYQPSNYYLFGNNITREDVSWAKENGIMAIGVVNAWYYKRSGDQDAEKDIQRLKAIGLQRFQIDSEFDRYFMK